MKNLSFEDNPIISPPQEILDQGKKAVFTYIRSLTGPSAQRYQAKLLLLGDGGEGKTCLSRALRGQEFQEQPTTHGVEFHPWVFPHPQDPENPEKQITLTIWDFEGQEITHQSHQFFLTRRSLYVLVFSGRKQIKQDRLIYWLDGIRNRAPGCQVLLVATESEGRTPTFDLEKLQAAFPDVLAEDPFYAIDSKSMKNIESLQQRLARLAVSLEFVPQTWPESLQKAEDQIAVLAVEKPEIGRLSLEKIFAEAGIRQSLFDIISHVFGDMGIITHFPYSPDLRNRILLRPQWLTRAISFALEHEQLARDQGELGHQWLAELWQKDFPGHYSFFHACMKEFELCYELNDKTHFSLVPLRFPYTKPQIPWVEIPDAVERIVEYRYRGNAPAGLISRFIVKTHHLITLTDAMPKGVFWHNGVFLEQKEQAFRAQALCELEVEARILRFTVRAAFPQNFIEKLHGFAEAVFSFYQGFKPDRYFGCVTPEEKPCQGKRH